MTKSEKSNLLVLKTKLESISYLDADMIKDILAELDMDLSIENIEFRHEINHLFLCAIKPECLVAEEFSFIKEKLIRTINLIIKNNN